MTFKDLIKARDDAVAQQQLCAEAEAEAHAAANAAKDRTTLAHDQAKAATVAAHKAIHDLLATRGEVFIQDDKGTFTVYKAVDLAVSEFGYVAVQPIPGALPTSDGK